MTASERMIRDIEKKSKERDGIRTKVRMSDALKKRAEACAKAAGCDFGEWVNLTCRKMKSGAYNDVAWEPETQNATRGESEAVWVLAPRGLNAPQIRLAVACGVTVCEPKIPPTFECALVEGKDYLVEQEV